MSARAIGALALWTTTVACTPEVPANPTYTNDVQPIFIAHCVRCHGAGDMLNAMLVNGNAVESTGRCSTPASAVARRP